MVSKITGKHVYLISDSIGWWVSCHHLVSLWSTNWLGTDGKGQLC